MLKISIVTVCYNEASSIVATLDSIANQTYSNIENIIKDGGSTDGTIDIVQRHKSGKLNIIAESSKDGGLYNGMNIGLSKCTGDYVLFVNAGDRLVSNDVIATMVAKAESEGLPDFVYGDCANEVNGELMVRTAHGPGFMKMGMPAAHESMLYKLSVIRERNIRYDARYRIAADYKFTYEFVKAAKTFAYVPMPIVVFSEGGVSTSHKWQGMMEANLVRRDVGGLSFCSRIAIVLVQSGVLLFSTFLGPVYRLIRLRRLGN